MQTIEAHGVALIISWWDEFGRARHASGQSYRACAAQFLATNPAALDERAVAEIMRGYNQPTQPAQPQA